MASPMTHLDSCGATEQQKLQNTLGQKHKIVNTKLSIVNRLNRYKAMKQKWKAMELLRRSYKVERKVSPESTSAQNRKRATHITVVFNGTLMVF